MEVSSYIMFDSIDKRLEQAVLDDEPTEISGMFLHTREEIDKKVELFEEEDKKSKFKEVKDALATMIYGKTDEELIENETKILKTITRYSILGILAITNIVVAALAWYIDRRIRRKMTRKQKERLVSKLYTELEIIEDKIENETDRDTKYALMRVRSEYRRSINKLESYKIR